MLGEKNCLKSRFRSFFDKNIFVFLFLLVVLLRNTTSKKRKIQNLYRVDQGYL
jgi:hypothetical protein